MGRAASRRRPLCPLPTLGPQFLSWLYEPDLDDSSGRLCAGHDPSCSGAPTALSAGGSFSCCRIRWLVDITERANAAGTSQAAGHPPSAWIRWRRSPCRCRVVKRAELDAVGPAESRVARVDAPSAP